MTLAHQDRVTYRRIRVGRALALAEMARARRRGDYYGWHLAHTRARVWAGLDTRHLDACNWIGWH